MSDESRRLNELFDRNTGGCVHYGTDRSWSADAGQLVNRRRGLEPTRDATLFYDAVVDEPGAAAVIDVRLHRSSLTVPRRRRRCT